MAGRIALRSSASSETVGVRTSTSRVDRFLDLLFFGVRLRLILAFLVFRFLAMWLPPIFSRKTVGSQSTTNRKKGPVDVTQRLRHPVTQLRTLGDQGKSLCMGWPSPSSISAIRYRHWLHTIRDLLGVAWNIARNVGATVAFDYRLAFNHSTSFNSLI